MDPIAIHELFKDVYGAFVNTDGFTVGAAAETHAAFIIVRVLVPLAWLLPNPALLVGNRSRA